MNPLPLNPENNDVPIPSGDHSQRGSAQAAEDPPRGPLSSSKRPRLSQLVFWSWNVVFVAFVFLGIAPFVLWFLLLGAIDGLVPWDFCLFSLLLVFVPCACMIFGVMFLRREPDKLLRLFYGIEGPLMLLCTARLFLVRELTPGVTQILCTLYAGAFFYMYEMLRGPIVPVPGPGPSRGFLGVQLFGQTLALLGGAYVAAMLLFYVPPAAWLLLKGFFEFDWVPSLGRMLLREPMIGVFFLCIALPLWFFSALLFLVTPPALVILYVRSFGRVQRAAQKHLGWPTAVFYPAVVVAISVAIFVFANRQPQGAAFARLAQPPRSDAERQTLLDHADELRGGLLNAYLGSYRYLSSTKQDNHIHALYTKDLPLGEAAADFLQRLHHGLARPLLFDGNSLFEDHAKAEELYEHFFDTPILKGERDQVLRALSATYSESGREAGLLEEGQRRVLLLTQEVQAERHGDWAEVELHELYQSQTGRAEEVFYYFSLPESAAVTGLWLGSSPKRSEAFPFKIAPRGAAQKVYRQQVRQRQDPALLEQVGPRQYRLRVFPVPVRSGRSSERLWGGGGRPEGESIHMWLTYRVLSDGLGFPLPRLLERRNVYWTSSSQRRIEGHAIKGNNWLPERLAGVSPPVAHTAVVDGVLVQAQPLTGAPGALPQGRALAVVLDRSYSMHKVAKEAAAALRQIQALAATNDVDVYLTSSPVRGEPPLRVDEPAALPPSATLFYGHDRLDAMLSQFSALQAGKAYAGVILLTDEGSLELAVDASAPLGMPAPLWLVHLGGQLAPGYDDAALLAIQRSGGGVTDQLDEALIAIEREAGGQTASRALDGYVWTTTAAAPGTTATADGFAALAARYVILTRTRLVQRGAASELDALHRLAVAQGVVSPYSSMLVLVNDAQRQALERAEKAADRFDRQVESGKDPLSTPGNPLAVSATPEPAEWLLVGVALLGLFYVSRRRWSPSAA